MRRYHVLNVLLLVLVLFMFCACAGYATAHIQPEPSDPIVQIERAVMQLITVLHHRLLGHATLPSHEWPLCLRGREHADTITIEDASAALVEEFSAVAVRFQCPSYNDLIGVWHNHVTEGPCRHSRVDSANAVASGIKVSLVTCGRPMEVDVWTRR